MYPPKMSIMPTLTEAHRNLWTELYSKPQLARVLSDTVDLEKSPVTQEEELFVHLLILHLRAWFKARRSGMDMDDDAVSADIQEFFGHPIPREVWENSKKFQGDDFVAFVESSIRPKQG